MKEVSLYTDIKFIDLILIHSIESTLFLIKRKHWHSRLASHMTGRMRQRNALAHTAAHADVWPARVPIDCIV